MFHFTAATSISCLFVKPRTSESFIKQKFEADPPFLQIPVFNMWPISSLCFQWSSFFFKNHTSGPREISSLMFNFNVHDCNSPQIMSWLSHKHLSKSQHHDEKGGTVPEGFSMNLWGESRQSEAGPAEQGRNVWEGRTRPLLTPPGGGSCVWLELLGLRLQGSSFNTELW